MSLSVYVVEEDISVLAVLLKSLLIRGACTCPHAPHGLIVPSMFLWS